MEPFRIGTPDDYVVETRASEPLLDGRLSWESAHLIFKDWLGRSCAAYVERVVPSKGQPVPGIIHCVGATQKVTLEDQLFWARHGYACATFDWQIADVPDRHPERASRWPREVVSQSHAQQHLEQAVLPIALQTAMATLGWLASHPQVDGDRMGMSGISWGGYLTWVTAAYDKRIKAIVPVYGCGILGAEEPVGTSPYSDEVRNYWKTHWDPPSLVSRQTAPVAYLSGTNDFFGDLLKASRMLEKLPVPYRWSLLANADHAIGPSETALAVSWMDHYLRNGPDVPTSPPAPAISQEGGSDDPLSNGSVTWWCPQPRTAREACWYKSSGAPPQAALAFRKQTFTNGLSLCSQLASNPTSKPATGTEPVWPNLVNGTGWRWELGSTQLHGNSVEIRPLGDGGQIEVTPASGDPEAPVALLLHQIHDPGWKPESGSAIEFKWSGETPPKDVTAAISLAGSPSWDETVFPCREKGGWYTITLPNGIDWEGVASLRIIASNNRQPFIFGPLRRG